jgi:DNA-binding NtrC family response regulator
LYRINTMEINLPPLRERKDDIVPMAHFLLKQLGENTIKAKSFWQNVAEYMERSLERKY